MQSHTLGLPNKSALPGCRCEDAWGGVGARTAHGWILLAPRNHPPGAGLVLRPPSTRIFSPTPIHILHRRRSKNPPTCKSWSRQHFAIFPSKGDPSRIRNVDVPPHRSHVLDVCVCFTNSPKLARSFALFRPAILPSCRPAALPVSLDLDVSFWIFSSLSHARTHTPFGFVSVSHHVLITYRRKVELTTLGGKFVNGQFEKTVDGKFEQEIMVMPARALENLVECFENELAIRRECLQSSWVVSALR